MSDPDLDQIGEALVRVARARAAHRPRRLRIPVVVGGLAAAAVLVGSLLLVDPWSGGGVARAAGPGFTQYVVRYDNGGSRIVGCAVARCATIVPAGERRVTSIELVALARNVRSARLVATTGRTTLLPPTARGGGSVAFRVAGRADVGGSVELLDASGAVVQTLRP
jgi:hypothetical protein